MYSIDFYCGGIPWQFCTCIILLLVYLMLSCVFFNFSEYITWGGGVPQITSASQWDNVKNVMIYPQKFIFHEYAWLNHHFTDLNQRNQDISSFSKLSHFVCEVTLWNTSLNCQFTVSKHRRENIYSEYSDFL